MYELTPDLEWYVEKSKSLKLSPRCPFATAENCPRCFQSLSLIRKAGFAGIDEKSDKKLYKKWGKTSLLPIAAEQKTSIGGRGIPGKYDYFTRFCPEISFLCFGLFASCLISHTDEIDREFAYSRLRKENYPTDHWRWTWVRIDPEHYSECAYYSLLLNFYKSKKINEENIIDLRPNIYGLGININSLIRKIIRHFKK